MSSSRIEKLSFKPMFHRKIAQKTYVRIPMKQCSQDTLEEAAREGLMIEREGFRIADKDMERPFKQFQNVDKGNVAGVIAQTNPEFRDSIAAEEL